MRILRASHAAEQVPEPHLALKGPIAELHSYRESVTFLKRPHLVIYYLVIMLSRGFFHLILKKRVHLALAGVALVAHLFVRENFEFYKPVEEFFSEIVLWMFLGFLSSFGMGFGLHTFVLFLAPTIFREASQPGATFIDTLQKVWLWSFSWGTGTAIGELPPYFTARAAREAGKKLDDLDDYEGVKHEDTSLAGRFKNAVISRLDHFGFWHIMLFASIPNPLFDLAGLACGYTLKPFIVFFGATFVGKAVFKSTLQTVFVISAHHSLGTIVKILDESAALSVLHGLKYFKEDLCESFAACLEKVISSFRNSNAKKLSFHTLGDVFGSAEGPGLRDGLVLLVLVLFLLSLIQNQVQSFLAEEEEAMLHAKSEQKS